MCCQGPLPTLLLVLLANLLGNQVYGDAADNIKTGDVYEFFGVVSEAL